MLNIRRFLPAPVKRIIRPFYNHFYQRLAAKSTVRRAGPHDDDHFFFVLGIGGSGTQWCAATFTTDTSYCFHEASNVLNTGHKRAFTHYAWLADPNQMDPTWRQNLVSQGSLQAMFDRMAARPEPIVGNSDQFVGWFCDALHAFRPSWKFLLVVRDGIKSVARFMRTLPWRPYQHFDRVWLPGWDAMSDFERSCYRWQRRNRLIYERLQGVPETHRRVETLESLTSDLTRLREVWDWLGLDDWSKYEARNSKFQNTRISRHKDSPGLKDAAVIWDQWTREQREMFMEICGDDMAFYGFSLPA